MVHQRYPKDFSRLFYPFRYLHIFTTWHTSSRRMVMHHHNPRCICQNRMFEDFPRLCQRRIHRPNGHHLDCRQLSCVIHRQHQQILPVCLCQKLPCKCRNFLRPVNFFHRIRKLSFPNHPYPYKRHVIFHFCFSHYPIPLTSIYSSNVKFLSPL